METSEVVLADAVWVISSRLGESVVWLEAVVVDADDSVLFLIGNEEMTGVGYEDRV